MQAYPVAPSHEVQVFQVLKLLKLKGASVEKELRNRVSTGRGVVAKGVFFEPNVLEEALHRWSARARSAGNPEAHNVRAPPGASAGKRAPPAVSVEEPVAPSRTQPATPPQKRARTAVLDGAGAPDLTCEKGSLAERTSSRLERQANAARPASLDRACGRAAVQGVARPLRPGRELRARGSAAPPETVRIEEDSEEEVAGPSGGHCDVTLPTSEPRPPEIEPEPRPTKQEPPETAQTTASPPRQPKSPLLERLAQGPPPGRVLPVGRPPPEAPPAQAMPERQAPSLAQEGQPPEQPRPAGHSVRELKALLSGIGLDISGCVEKAELQAMSDRLTFLRGWPLEELQACCAASGGSRLATKDACACFLISTSMLSAPAPGSPTCAEHAGGAPPAKSAGPGAAPRSGSGAASSTSAPHCSSAPSASASPSAPAAPPRSSAPTSPSAPASPRRSAAPAKPAPAAPPQSSHQPQSSAPSRQAPSMPGRSGPASAPSHQAPSMPGRSGLGSAPSPPPPVAQPPCAAHAAEREAEAAKEVARILPLRRERFGTAAAWGLAVLNVAAHDVPSVQRAYRALMRKLHPDKAGHDPGIAQAAEWAREAKDACERSLSTQEPPGMPCRLRSSMVCSTPGRRRLQLQWSAPPARSAAPVRRYVVAVVDPAYGKALTVAVLEPDYSEELRRFVSVEELASHVLSEEELQKMPSLWKQAKATVQVAAANEAGQSPWAILHAPLTAGSFRPAYAAAW